MRLDTPACLFALACFCGGNFHLASPETPFRRSRHDLFNASSPSRSRPTRVLLFMRTLAVQEMDRPGRPSPPLFSSLSFLPWPTFRTGRQPTVRLPLF